MRVNIYSSWLFIPRIVWWCWWSFFGGKKISIHKEIQRWIYEYKQVCASKYTQKKIE
jgi:hypothetical protein